jgi:hypothetical protein
MTCEVDGAGEPKQVDVAAALTTTRPSPTATVLNVDRAYDVM